MVKRRRVRDAGSSLIEVLTGIAVAMIAFGLVATTLSSAQRQERIVDQTARSVDTARVALARITNEAREARIIELNGSDAVAWFDHDADGLRGAGEEVTWGFRPDGSLQQLSRIADGVSEQLAGEVTGGSFAVALLSNGYRLTITVTVPGTEGHAGTTLTSAVGTRGNL